MINGLIGALELRALSCQVHDGRGPVDLLDDVNLAVAPGEILAIVGPNGAGKTSLVRLMAGLLTPSSGEVRLDGRAVHRLSANQRAREIAWVGQAEEPDGRLTVNDYVGLGRLPYQGHFPRSQETEPSQWAIAKSGLYDLRCRRLDQLSGGERQKAKIARALCQQPSLLLLDEPTNHLDPRARGELLGLVASMGITVVVVLHDLTLIDAIADQVAIIADGRLLDVGVPTQALSPRRVRSTFGVDLHRFNHPDGERQIPALDLNPNRQGSTLLDKSTTLALE